jgi:uncharacterized protein (DUF1330 family)
MSAYIIFIREKTLDQSAMDTYNGIARHSLEGHPATLLALYGEQQVLEGPDHEGVVILEFPSLQEAKAWYDSPAYQAAIRHRRAASEYRVFIVEGL